MQLLERKIVVQFWGAKIFGDSKFRRFHPNTLKKLNNFSANEIIRIKSDEPTASQIEKEFGRIEIASEKVIIIFPEFKNTISYSNLFFQLEGAVGRVTAIDIENPEKIYVLFDEDHIYHWLDKAKSLPSWWFEKHRTIQPAFDQEIETWIAKGSELFLKAVEIGDLRSAQLLFKKDKSVADAARNADGKDALHIGCTLGYKDLVRWLVDVVMMDVDKPGHDGLRPIHHTVKE